MTKMTTAFKINGKNVEIESDGNDSLLSILRHHLNLTGTKYSCGIGQCGACTVLIDDLTERSCMIMMEDMEGKEVLTIEGLGTVNELHPIQKSFVEKDALQCGFCTPGMIMNAYGLLLKNPDISRNEIISGMDENLCRCGSYNNIVDAIQVAAESMNKKVKL